MTIVIDSDHGTYLSELNMRYDWFFLVGYLSLLDR